jgi:hypothetical protein
VRTSSNNKFGGMVYLGCDGDGAIDIKLVNLLTAVPWPDDFWGWVVVLVNLTHFSGLGWVVVPVPLRDSPWGLPEGDMRRPKAHHCNDRTEDFVQVLLLSSHVLFPVVCTLAHEPLLLPLMDHQNCFSRVWVLLQGGAALFSECFTAIRLKRVESGTHLN